MATKRCHCSGTTAGYVVTSFGDIYIYIRLASHTVRELQGTVSQNTNATATFQRIVYDWRGLRTPSSGQRLVWRYAVGPRKKHCTRQKCWPPRWKGNDSVRIEEEDKAQVGRPLLSPHSPPPTCPPKARTCPPAPAPRTCFKLHIWREGRVPPCSGASQVQLVVCGYVPSVCALSIPPIPQLKHESLDG